MSAATANVKVALELAGGKAPVFPLLPGDKRPATKNGFKDASTDAEQIRSWWREHAAGEHRHRHRRRRPRRARRRRQERRTRRRKLGGARR